VVDDRELPAELVRFEHVVGGQEHGAPHLLQPLNQLAEISGAERVQTRSGLVEEQDLRVREQRASEVQALTHPPRESHHPLVGTVAKIHQFQQLVATPGGLRRHEVIDGREVAKVLVGGNSPEEAPVTAQREAYLLPHLARLADHVVPTHASFPGGRMQERGEDPNGRRLARSVGAEESEDLPTGNLQ